MSSLKEALYYRREGDDDVQCILCPHMCRIASSGYGKCGVRINKNGTLYSLNYCRVSSVAMDPIEKKPLYHFHPGKNILSAGTIGCNFKCPFCQNWTTSQGGGTTRSMRSNSLVDLALDNRSIGIAYTYNEPFIWYEYVLESAQLAREKGLVNVLVSNGFVNPDPLVDLLQYVDAMNIDLKSFEESFYAELCGGRLKPVINTIETASEEGCHVELTTLIIPDRNDDMEMIERMCEWIASINKEIPLHFSRYSPNYQMHVPATPMETLLEARNIALKYLDYVYLGNVYETEFSSTYCPECSSEIISRVGYNTKFVGFDDGKCAKCKTPIAIVD